MKKIDTATLDLRQKHYSGEMVYIDHAGTFMGMSCIYCFNGTVWKRIKAHENITWFENFKEEVTTKELNQLLKLLPRKEVQWLGTMTK